MSELKDKAQEMLAGRLSALDAIESANGRLSAARDELRAAEGAIAGAWSTATDAGWTPGELRKLGLTQPPSRRGGRPKSRRSTPPSGE